MPNWCENYMDVEGPAEKLALLYLDIRENVDEGRWLLGSLLPRPESTEKQLEESDGCFLHEIGPPRKDEAWYYWNVHNWGTKWDVALQDVSGYPYNKEQGNCWSLAFDTAWSPPIEWVARVARKYEDLKFSMRFYELGCYFAGERCWENGALVHTRDGEPTDFEFCKHLVEEEDLH
jgi:hypothetical protein